MPIQSIHCKNIVSKNFLRNSSISFFFFPFFFRNETRSFSQFFLFPYDHPPSTMFFPPFEQIPTDSSNNITPLLLIFNHIFERFFREGIGEFPSRKSSPFTIFLNFISFRKLARERLHSTIFEKQYEAN